MRRHPFLVGLISLFGIFVVFIFALWFLNRLGFGTGLPIGKDKIVVVEIEGVLTKSRPTIEKLLQYKKDESIKAIVLRINSPGGGVSPAQEIYQELTKLRDTKYIIASMESVAASGGYYIACAAHKIVANPGTITGSIGVIIEFANMEELLDKIGLKSVVIKSGKYKDIMSPTRQISKEEQELLQAVIDSVHNQFISAVAQGRGIPKEKVVAIADGRIFSGEQAKEIGLVDELGNLQDAIKTATQMSGIEGEPHIIYPKEKRPSIWEILLGESLSTLSDFVDAQDFTIGFLFAPGTFETEKISGQKILPGKGT
jgi:protease-4